MHNRKIKGKIKNRKRKSSARANKRNVSGMSHHVGVTHGEYQDKLFSSLMNTEDETSKNRKIKK